MTTDQKVIGLNPIGVTFFAEIAQLVEHNLAKVGVASSSLVFRSCFFEMMELSFAQVAELVDAHVSGACAARRAGSIPVLGTIPIEDSAGGVIHFTPPVFCLCRFGGHYSVSPDIIWAHPINLGEPS